MTWKLLLIKLGKQVRTFFSYVRNLVAGSVLICLVMMLVSHLSLMYSAISRLDWPFFDSSSCNHRWHDKRSDCRIFKDGWEQRCSSWLFLCWLGFCLKAEEVCVFSKIVNVLGTKNSFVLNLCLRIFMEVVIFFLISRNVINVISRIYNVSFYLL